MNRNQTHLLLSALILLPLLVGCAHSDTLIIDGEMAEKLNNRINVLAYDEFLDRRGTSLSNLRNGGEMLATGDTLFFIEKMVFDDGSETQYLKSVPSKYLDSWSTEHVFISEIYGPLVARVGNDLYFLDEAAGNLPSRVNLETFAQGPVTEIEATSFQFLDDRGYFSDRTGNLYRFISGENPEIEMILPSAGRLVSVEGDAIFTVTPSKEGNTISIYDPETLTKISQVSLRTSSDIQISGDFIYYLAGDQLMRVPIGNGTVERASVIPTREYAIENHYLIIAGTEGNLYGSRLDGTDIHLLSEDDASTLHLRGELLFYRNGYDLDAWYGIRLPTADRFAVRGETMTDGGIHFFPLNESENEEAIAYFSEFIEKTGNRTGPDKLFRLLSGDSVLFVDIRDEQFPQFYSYEDTYTSLDQTDFIVSLTNKEVLLGRYTDNYLAYRNDTLLSLYSLKEPAPLLTLVQEGLPPIAVKHGKGDRYGVPASWHPKALEIMDLL